MDDLGLVKSEASRHHPEDVSSSDEAYSEKEDSTDYNLSEDDDLDEDRPSASYSKSTSSELPGTGPNDMPLLKTSSHFGGSWQTGVKGVIADATSFESARRLKFKRRPESSYGGYMDEPKADAMTPLNRSTSSGESEEEEDFVRTWRKNRLEELRTGVATTRRQSPSKRKFGRVEAVDAAGYLDAVDKVARDTIVVVTITSDDSEESKFVEDCLYTLARKYPTTRFVKLHHMEAEMDEAIVPAMLAYKNGDLFANLVRIVDEIPPGRNLSADSLELVLRRANVLHRD